MTDSQEKVLLDNNSKLHEMFGIMTGGNGGGIVRDVRNAEGDIKILKDEMVTKDFCSAQHFTITSRKIKTWGAIKDVMLVLLSGVVGWAALKGGP